MTSGSQTALRVIRASGGDLVDWALDVSTRLPAFRRQVTVDTSNDLTEVSIDYRLPAPSRNREARFRLTTQGSYHLPASFGWAGTELNSIRRDSKQRGRGVYCIDLETQSVISAIGYHIDERSSLAIFVRGIATLETGDPAAIRVSRGTAVVILGLLHVVAEHLERPGYLDFNAPNRQVADDARVFGFRPARRPAAFSHAPRYAYLRQHCWWKR